MLVAYAPAIHQAIASGDLAQMKAMVIHAENSLKETGNVAAALEVLKNEIAKLERKS